jgi:hypothetical protein
MFAILNFGHWDLFEICDLKFGIFLRYFKYLGSTLEQALSGIVTAAVPQTVGSASVPTEI